MKKQQVVWESWNQIPLPSNVVCVRMSGFSSVFFFSLAGVLSRFLFIYLFMAVLGLHCCVRAFSSCSEWGLLFVAVHGLLTVVASLVAEHRLEACRLQ